MNNWYLCRKKNIIKKQNEFICKSCQNIKEVISHAKLRKNKNKFVDYLYRKVFNLP